MKKIHYNLARNRKINGRAFAAILGVLLLALVALNGVTAANLVRLQRQQRLEENEIKPMARKMEINKQQMLEYRKKIAVWKKTGFRELAFANSLIQQKSFSFSARLNFLEKVLGPGIRVHSLSIANDAQGLVTLTITALAQNQLMALYKKLLPYELVIAHENQSRESYQAKLSFRMEDEKE